MREQVERDGSRWKKVVACCSLTISCSLRTFSSSAHVSSRRLLLLLRYCSPEESHSPPHRHQPLPATWMIQPSRNRRRWRCSYFCCCCWCWWWWWLFPQQYSSTFPSHHPIHHMPRYSPCVYSFDDDDKIIGVCEQQQKKQCSHWAREVVGMATGYCSIDGLCKLWVLGAGLDALFLFFSTKDTSYWWVCYTITISSRSGDCLAIWPGFLVSFFLFVFFFLFVSEWEWARGKKRLVKWGDEGEVGEMLIINYDTKKQSEVS